jgi:hypothetical protein
MYLLISVALNAQTGLHNMQEKYMSNERGSVIPEMRTFIDPLLNRTER